MSGKIKLKGPFQRDAVAQIVEKGYSVRDVAARIGINPMLPNLSTSRHLLRPNPRKVDENHPTSHYQIDRL